MKVHKVRKEILEPLVLLGHKVFAVPAVIQAQWVQLVIQVILGKPDLLDPLEQVVSLGLQVQLAALVFKVYKD